MSVLRDKLKKRSPADFLSPRMWRKGVRYILGRRQTEREDAAICEAGDGVAPPPHIMVLEATLRCNLRCKMCYLTDEMRSGKPADELTLDQIRTIVGNAGVRDVNLVGGEVFIRKDFFDILDFLRASGRHCPTITTNGTLLSADRAERLVPFLMDGTVGSLTFSIDGPEETHDDVRGKGMFQRTLTGMRNVLEAATRQGGTLPNHFNVNIVVSESNFRHFDEVADVVADLNVGYIEVNHLMFHTPKEIGATRRLLKEPQASVFQSGVEEVPRIDAGELLSTLQRLRERTSARGIDMGTRPIVRDHEIAKTYGEKFWPKAQCLSPYHRLRIQSDGTVYFCQNIHTVMGDLKTQSLDEIWNNARFRRFRSILLQRHILPICKRCCRVDRL